MNELVTLRGNDCFTNSLVIAEGTENEHRAILQLIGKYEEKLNRWGKVLFSHLKCGNNERDLASIKQLNTLDDVESMIFHIIRRGMAQCKHYKEIYQDCKIRLDAFLEITFGEQRLIA